jgi:hypothetical protein
MTKAIELAALKSRLEISGADRTRWPAQERLRFASMLTQDKDAQRLVAEAAALDRLLDVMPAPDPARLGSLIDRIVAAAEAEGAPSAENVVSITTARRPAAPARTPIHQRSSWQAAALLAASLFVGAFVGTSGMLESAVPGLTGATYDVADLDATELVLDGNRSSLLEEDTL